MTEALPQWMAEMRTPEAGHEAVNWRMLQYVERPWGRRARVPLVLEGRDVWGHVTWLVVEVGRPAPAP